jgi:glucan 1,3-beta-glucosidase
MHSYLPYVRPTSPERVLILEERPDVEESFNNDLKAITAVAQKYKDTIYAVTVGSETLYRGNFTGPELKAKIDTVKSKLPANIKVGTADSWNKFDDGTADAILPSVDILMINAFAFWQGAGGENATHVYLNDMFQAISHIEKVVGGSDKIEIWNGETGWPTAGESSRIPLPYSSD